MAMTPGIVRIAAMSDIHVSKTGQGALASVFAQVSERADVLVMCGDLTDYGLPEEARVLARDVGTALRVPCVTVLGNHDFEAGKADEVRQILTDAGVTVLDGDACELQGVGFAGVKGFCGGFGRGALGPWGEDIIKLFVREKMAEGNTTFTDSNVVLFLHGATAPSTCDFDLSYKDYSWADWLAKRGFHSPRFPC